MFTDQLTTPLRVETLLNLLREFDAEPLTAAQVDALLQPTADKYGRRGHATALRSAAEELRLTRTDGDKVVLAAEPESRSTRDLVLDAMDEHVLAATDVEPYFALFYSYLLGSDADGSINRPSEAWVSDFERDVPDGKREQNQFNPTKITGMHRWLAYLGLGWYDPASAFQPNPYGRIRRQLPKIFGQSKRLDGDSFMEALARACPELDGGEIFRRANRDWTDSVRVCTLGLSHALVDLHLDGEIRLICPRDVGGWSLERCRPEPRFDGKTFVSPAIQAVEWPEGN